MYTFTVSPRKNPARVTPAASANAIALPLEKAVGDAGERPAVETLRRDTQALKRLLAEKLAPALGLPLGFNALDGD